MLYLNLIIVVWGVFSVFRFNNTFLRVTTKAKEGDLAFTLIVYSYVGMNLLMCSYYIVDFVCHFYGYSLW